MRKNLFLALGLALAITSCQTITEEVNLTSSVSFKSEIATKVAGGQFESGDEISVISYLNGTTHDDALYAYSGGSFTSTDPIELESTQSLSYTAIYPATTSNTTAFDFTISTDQSVADNYEQSDLLVANLAATSSLEPTLVFNHALSQIVVNVEVDGAAADIATSAIEFYAKNTVSCDATAATYTATGSAATITPAANGTSSFLAIIAPQTIDAAATLATLEIDGLIYYWTRSTEQYFLSGNQYVYTWSVNTATGESTVTIDANINDWNEGETEPEEPLEPAIPGEPYLFSGSMMMTAMGKTEEDFVDQRIYIEDCVLDNGLTINGALGTHTTIAPCVWNGSSTDVRIYKGNTITFSHATKRILSLTFTSTHNYMTGPDGYEAPASAYDSSTWTGEAYEITFSTSEASYLDSLTVILEADPEEETTEE